jgi:hypothetical protein
VDGVGQPCQAKVLYVEARHFSVIVFLTLSTNDLSRQVASVNQDEEESSGEDDFRLRNSEVSRSEPLDLRGFLWHCNTVRACIPH